MTTHESLKEEVKILREKVRCLEEEKSAMACSGKNQLALSGNEKCGSSGVRVNKFFPKDLKCPVRTCHRKYSSKIALNAHLRAKHRRANTETGDYLP